ncbi:MAG: rhodanese-like domain-containing protein [Ilumatobacteraceae bacterium]
MQNTRKMLAAAATALALVAGASACGGQQTSEETAVAQGQQQAQGQQVIIDVRTPEEFATGHLPGARNLDLNGGDFAAALAGLDKGASYLLYCRSGNRSGMALEMMQQAGFADVKNLGSVQEAADALGTVIATD